VTAAEEGWEAVRAELDARHAAGRTAEFWLRDDDAVAASPALDRLLGLVSAYGAPLMVAAIPMRLERSLKPALAPFGAVSVAVHGAWHRNHAPPPSKAEETPAQRGLDAIGRDLSAARARLVAEFGPAAGRWYVPPWNRIPPAVAALLPGLGFHALSAFAARPGPGRPGLGELPATVDVIDWRNGRIGRPETWLAAEIGAQLAAQRRAGRPWPIGVLCHHLVHDEAAWSGLQRLLDLVVRHPGAAWRAADVLLPGRSSALPNRTCDGT
jgi:peptidoglycan/xylan/chitin deacetylase (PgdA/CDA1 family)